MTDPVIDATAVTFRYRSADSDQLRDITFRVAPGERVAVMGATGAGKTTLMMALNGLVPHHHEGSFGGRLTVTGLDVAITAVTDLVRHVGLVMQDPESQITGRTVIDDAAVGPANLGLPREEVLARAEGALDAVGLGDLKRQDSSHLSGGQQQRLAVAGILAMEPQILVLDEPTSELDPAGAEQVFEVVSRLAGEGGRTVLLVAHEPELVAAWADRLLVLSAGRITFDGHPRDFFADADAVAAAGLRAPGVTSAFEGLRAAGLVPPTAPAPVTLAEAVAALPVRVSPRAPAEPAPEAEREIVVEAVDLRHRYPSGVEALAGVSLRIRDGDFVALLGRNGAGKTTFARHLIGLLRPTSGELRINGRSAAGRKIHDLATEVGYVFQNPDHQIFANSVHDEIAFGLRNQGRGEAEIKERVAAVLAQVGMPGVQDLHPYRLGKGQRQRLAVASVLALEPRILVIDEPTTGQDWTGSVAMLELVAELNRAGHTICMITHDMLLAAEYARRAVVFSGGRLSADLPIGELFADPDRLAAAGLRPPQVTELALAVGLGPARSPAEFVAAWGGADAS